MNTQQHVDGTRRSLIVVGVDGSPESRAALRWALREAAERGDDVEAVTVRQPEPAYMPAAALVSMPCQQPPQHPESHQLEQLRDAIAEARRNTPAAPEVTELATTGDPAQVLVEAADDARLLVVGRRGIGRIGTALLGSVAASCARHASCPVVMIPSTMVRGKR